MMKITINHCRRPGLRGSAGMLYVGLVLLLACLVSCKKSAAPAKANLTPLQNLINSDTSLSLFHFAVLQANETRLLADDSVTVLIPTNDAFRSAGYSWNFIDSFSASMSDRLIRYHFSPSRITITDSGVYHPNPTILGYPVYSMSDGIITWFNGVSAIRDTAFTGRAIVYKLNRPLVPAADSLNALLASDSSLSFLAEVFLRTNLYDSLLLSGDFTLLAPTNQAFLNAGFSSIAAIDSADLTTLIRLAEYQVVKGIFFTNTLAGFTSLPTLEGETVAVSQQNGLIRFTGVSNTVAAGLVLGNQLAGNTILVHRIDQVLAP